MTMEEYYAREIAGAREDGEDKGLAKGEARINNLYQKLRDSNRLEDLFKAMDDSDYRAQLLEEFGL